MKISYLNIIIIEHLNHSALRLIKSRFKKACISINEVPRSKFKGNQICS